MRPFLLLLMLAGPLVAADPAVPKKVTPPPAITTDAGTPTEFVVDNPDKLPVLAIHTGIAATRFRRLHSDDATKLVYEVFSKSPGSFVVNFVVNSVEPGKPPAVAAELPVTILGVGPQPPSPIPEPPGPTPVVPIPDAGFRVLMVYESSELARIPRGQAAVLGSTVVRQYLDSHCVKEGNQAAYRLYDKDANVDGDLPVWRAAMKRDRKSLPWIIISDGKTGFEGPIPATVEATMELLKKYGGA